MGEAAVRHTRGEAGGGCRRRARPAPMVRAPSQRGEQGGEGYATGGTSEYGGVREMPTHAGRATLAARCGCSDPGPGLSPLASPAVHHPAVSWDTQAQARPTLVVWLAEDATPRHLPFPRALIEDCGAGVRLRHAYARSYMLRRLKQMGLRVP